MHQIPDPLTQKAGNLYSRIERYVLQKLDHPTTGRGTSLQYVQRPLVDPGKPWLWRRGSLAYWGQIELRLQQLLHRPSREPKHQCELQKLGWHVKEHWRPDAPVKVEGFQMLFDVLWHQRGDERIRVLLNYARKQRELHQEESMSQETEEYRQWLTKATSSGCRRTLKRDETPYLRPFQGLPRVQRAPQRVRQWGAIWQVLDRTGAAHHERTGRGSAEKHSAFWSNAGSQRALPSVEEQAMIPSQAIERPIALVATLYRLWCRLRNVQTKQWASNIQQDYAWERAVPGTECLQNITRPTAQRRCRCYWTCPTSFYQLANRWLNSSYPATHAAIHRHQNLGS